jgi:hypothetical protein
MPELKAANEVLIAAASIVKGDISKEFTEWELTVETWRLNKNRWGLRGFEAQYPDHKRVMMELMGLGGLVKEGFLKRTRENHYTVTSAGLAQATAITEPRDTRQRNIYIYDDVSTYAFHRIFESYLQNSDEPKTWLGVASFLALQKNDPGHLNEQLARVKKSIGAARKFMEDTNRTDLRRGDADRIITRERLDKLEQFLGVLEERFQPQFEAIRLKAR